MADAAGCATEYQVPPLAVYLLHPPTAHRANEWHEAISENEDDKETSQKPDKAGQAEVRDMRFYRLLVVEDRARTVSDHASSYGESKL